MCIRDSVCRDRLPHEAHVEVESDTFDVPGLLAAEQVAGPADLQGLHGHLDARAEVGVAGDLLESVVVCLGVRLLRGAEEVLVGPLPASTDPPAQLVQLRQPEYCLLYTSRCV